MSAAQTIGDDWWHELNRFDPVCPCGCGGVYGLSCQNTFRLPPPPSFLLSAEEEPLFPTTPPGVLLMPEDDPINLKPSTIPAPPESTTDPSATLPETTKGDSYFASAAREFRDCLVELRATRREIGDGFRGQGADLRIIRHEIQGIALRLSAVEEKQLAHAGDIADLKTSQRDVRADLRQLKEDLTNALERVSALEADLPKAQTSVPAPPSSTSA